MVLSGIVMGTEISPHEQGIAKKAHAALVEIGKGLFEPYMVAPGRSTSRDSRSGGPRYLRK